MTTATLSRLGVANNTSDGSWSQDNALFLKESLPEVLAEFDDVNVFKALHRTRSITKGKSAGFPALGGADARYHIPGTPVLGSNNIPRNEVIIKVDDLLLSDVVIDDLDDAKDNIDVRMEFSKQLGAALARSYDQKVARVIAKAARSGGIVSGRAGGSRIENAAAASDSSVLADLLYTAAENFDEKDVSEDDRFVAIRPAQFWSLVRNKDLQNRDYGGKGSYVDGDLPVVAGMTLVKTKHVPKTNIAAPLEGENNDYTGDFSKTVALAFNRMAAGTVELRALTMQMTGDDFNAMYQADMMIAKMAVGHGILRTDCAQEIATGALV